MVCHDKNDVNPSSECDEDKLGKGLHADLDAMKSGEPKRKVAESLQGDSS